MFSRSTLRPSTADRVGQSPSKFAAFVGFIVLDLRLFPPCLVRVRFVSLALPEDGTASRWAIGANVTGSDVLMVDQ